MVSLKDLGNFDSSLTQELVNRPTDYIHVFEEAATEVVEDLTKSRSESESIIDTCQILIDWEANSVSLREIRSEQVSKLIKMSGIIISASGIRAKAVKLSLQCRSCRQFLPNLPVKPGLEGYTLPRNCPSSQMGGAGARCPIDPFFIVPDKCLCVDYQILKLQETPETVPHGEMPRHVQLYCDRYLCEQVVPGNRVTVVGVYTIKSIASFKQKSSAQERANVGVRQPYVRVLGLLIDTEGPGRSGIVGTSAISSETGAFKSGASSFNKSTSTGASRLTEVEEDELRSLAASPDVFDRVANSIAPSIYGSLDIKKAIACLLFGGSRKRYSIVL
ncbi:unnamed protein product [Protopolystoma xenopodis]|uniref:DNA replication licensing factor MCM5 n=1 Tax=Protopolystoma xenopodis TaxID=117903 RepID=A0A3S5CKH8_9PLAT|nr:unnamed protein product [Protopolystoma xenopodis]